VSRPGEPIDDGARSHEQPPYDSPGYRSTELRAPRRPLVLLPPTLSERTGPTFGEDAVSEADSDLTGCGLPAANAAFAGAQRVPAEQADR
jgi:hypothetical protein